ncbi:ABC transporter substrate-binding protein [Paenibacillus sp. NPDC057967]|uniref:ABC transporter substrate-binding protein n=1 Tax=Paenibacillus sp. NPDC057967 TaxID=3346293 RepID=UPI0036DBAE82
MSGIKIVVARLCVIGVITALLAACGQQSGQQSGQQPEQAMRSFEHASGVTDVPFEPMRVAADQHMGQLLKLGIKPIAVRENMLKETWIPYANLEEGALDGIEDLGGFPLNLEKLTLVEPDLIINALPANQEQYSKIAPTVHMPYWSEKYKSPMDKFLDIADLFNKTDVANQWISEFDAKLATAGEKIVSAGRLKPGETVSVMAVFQNNVYVFGPNGAYGGYLIYDALKLPTTEHAEVLRGKDMGSSELSMEVVPEYMGDHAFITVVDESKADELMKSDFWKSVPAVKNNQVYFYDSKIFAMDDPYSLEAQLGIVTDLLTQSQ